MVPETEISIGGGRLTDGGATIASTTGSSSGAGAGISTWDEDDWTAETDGTRAGYGSFAAGSGAAGASSAGELGAAKSGEVITPEQCGQGAVVGGRFHGIKIFPSQ